MTRNSEDDDVVETLSGYRSHKPLDIWIRVRHRLHVVGAIRPQPFV
jgi:hypothetical protein